MRRVRAGVAAVIVTDQLTRPDRLMFSTKRVLQHLHFNRIVLAPLRLKRLCRRLVEEVYFGA